MNTLETNRTNMIRSTCSYCTNNAAATSSITGYAPIVTQAINKLVLIDALDQIAMGTTKGVTLDTNALRNVMEVDAEKLANALGVLAAQTNNSTLEAAVNYPLSKLQGLKKDEVDDVCETIHDLAVTHALAIVPFGITATDITDTATAINLYRIGMQNPRQKKIDIKEANRQIHEMIHDVIANLFKRQLDRLTNTLITSNSIYYNGYYAAREIIDLGTGTTRVKGDVFEQGTDPLVPIYQAAITLNPGSITIQTDLHGEFVQKVEHGTYSGTCTHPDFGTVNIAPFLVKLGETVELHLQMSQQQPA